jgi:general secretion pathway protein G
LHSVAGQAARDRLPFDLLSGIYFAPLRLCEGYYSPPNARAFPIAVGIVMAILYICLLLMAVAGVVLVAAVISICATCMRWVAYLCRRRIRDDFPRCRKCEYLLIGIDSQRCPECGTPLLPENIRRGDVERPRYPSLDLIILLLDLGLVVFVFLPKFAGRTGDSRPIGAWSDVSNLKVALDAFQIDNGRFPTPAEGLNILVNPPNGGRAYVDKVPIDPWGTPYIYRVPGKNGQDFDLFSCGPDGIPDTADDVGR